jgi:predicted enzyme related to lactoylglutathione lyase
VLDRSDLVAFVSTTDLERARQFYEGVLDLRVVDANPFALVVDAHGTQLRITRVDELHAQPFTVLGWKVDDIVATIDALCERGVRFMMYDGMPQDELGIWTTPDGSMVAWFSDPDGNTLSLTQPAGG